MIKYRFNKTTCTGCSRAKGTEHQPFLRMCTVYSFVPSSYIRLGSCPFNVEPIAVPKRKIRVGQQKQKKGI
jgi:hypothetical protein